MAVVGNFTYSGDPSDSELDAVRFLIRDTDEATAQLSDEEIQWMLVESGHSIYRAAVGAVDFIVTNFATQARTRTVGALSISYEARADEYRKLALALHKRWLAFTNFIPYAGGISRSDKQANQSDTDWDKPAFVRNLHGDPSAITEMREVPRSS